MQDNKIMVICDGEKQFVANIKDAQSIANEKGLDLIEVAQNVYKVMDYKKYLYDSKKNAKQQKKQTVKDAQFNFGIAENDLQRKVRDIKKWLSDGCAVRVIIRLHGREASRPELADYIVNAVVNAVTSDKLVSETPKPKQIDGAHRDIQIMLKPAKK